MSNQMYLALIPHEVANSVIHQRATDGYVNGTAMCKACGKLFADYRRLSNTEAFLDELSSVMGIPITALVVIRQGGSPEEQGTWVHPDVAINLGQWCAPKFAVAVSRWVREWMSGKFSTPRLPYHIVRYLANVSEIPRTHFSMLNGRQNESEKPPPVVPVALAASIRLWETEFRNHGIVFAIIRGIVPPSQQRVRTGAIGFTYPRLRNNDSFSR